MRNLFFSSETLLTNFVVQNQDAAMASRMEGPAGYLQKKPVSAKRESTFYSQSDKLANLFGQVLEERLAARSRTSPS